METKLLQEDSGVVLIILIAISILLLTAVALVIFFFFSRKKVVATEVEKAQVEISNKKEQLQATIETQEEERKRIAQGLHDAISSKLNVVTLNTNVLIDGGLEEQQQQATLNHILDITNKTLESSRDLEHNLLPPILENFGLQAALEELCDEFRCNKELEIDAQISYCQSLSKQQELHVFRIVQELLNNSVCDRAATLVTLKYEEQLDSITIYYSDNGKGSHNGTEQKTTGIGLRNIESRVDILGGTLSYDDCTGQGTIFGIHINNPVTEKIK